MQFSLQTLAAFTAHCLAAEAAPAPAPGLSGGGYLAQHSLLDQLPALAADVRTPELVHMGIGRIPTLQCACSSPLYTRFATSIYVCF